MNEIISGIGIFVLGILITIGAIEVVQRLWSQNTDKRPGEEVPHVPPEMYIIENLAKMPGDLSGAQLQALHLDLVKRYHLPDGEAGEVLSFVMRSRAFERVAGARCTCYADSKQYGKYFHAPSCEYRQFLERKGRK
jgi:hypothetical protein